MNVVRARATMRCLVVFFYVCAHFGGIWCCQHKINVKVFSGDHPQGRILTVDSLNDLEDAYKMEATNENIPNLCKGFIKNVPKLDTLILDGDGINELEVGAFSDANTLRILHIKNNQISTIKNGVFNHLNVRTLDLANNSIELVESGAFDDMPELATIELHFNQITKVDPLWLANCPKLHRLNLAANQIVEIPERAFPNLAGKETDIWLMSNKIEKIKKAAFDGIVRFQYLWLQDNKITDIEADVFSNIEHIEGLSLDANKLTCLSDELLSKISVAKSINLDENPLDCNCYEKIKGWAKRKGIATKFTVVRIQCMKQRIEKLI